jgi:exosome complex component MTR3
VKLSCTVFGPRPLPRSAPFTPQLLLSTYVKLAPFATRQRRSHIRGATERDLSIHLETALRGVIIGERWPKSGVDIVITVLESEGDYPQSNDETLANDIRCLGEGWGIMSILSGCITVASAALADAGIDCVDLVCGGMAAVVRQPAPTPSKHPPVSALETPTPNIATLVVLDPRPSEHQELIAGCVVGYLPSRDEITELWAKGDGLASEVSPISGLTRLELLIDQAVEAAKAVQPVLKESINECTETRLKA